MKKIGITGGIGSGKSTVCRVFALLGASIVFHNPERLAQLNALVHPAVAADFEQWAQKQPAPYVIEESAILFEAGADRNMDETVAVVAPEALQMSDQERMARADHILVADEKRLLIPQIIELHKRFIQ